jgi:DNA polymerase III epsilon subunit family exonuclease
MAHMTAATGAKLTDLVLVAFDTETTGLDPRAGRVVEIAGVKFTLGGELIGTFTSLVNPGLPIPPRVTRIHGITDEEVRGWPPASIVLREFFRFVGGPDTVLVAHNAPFDIGFVREEFVRNDLALPVNPILCSLQLARRHLPFMRSYALGEVARALQLPVDHQHRAFPDSLLVRGIAVRLLNTYPVSATLAEVRGGRLHSLIREIPAPPPGAPVGPPPR